jgi:hypothetical protein
MAGVQQVTRKKRHTTPVHEARAQRPIMFHEVPAEVLAPPFIQIVAAVHDDRTRLFGLAQDGTVWEYIVGKYSSDPSGWRQLRSTALAQVANTPPVTPWGLGH